MKRLVTLFALLAALLLAACSPATTAPAPADEPLPALTLLPDDAAPETSAAPDAQADNTDAQAPPTEAANPEEVEQAAPDISTQPEAVPGDTEQTEETNSEPALPEDGSYTSKEDVALYLHLYGHLPDNFITKKEAEKLGWPGGSLEPYAPGKSIGGSRFGNYEGLLPDAPGRKWTECDIDTQGAKSRGAKRIVFSNDGLIYYTGDHYKSFELLFGEE